MATALLSRSLLFAKPTTSKTLLSNLLSRHLSTTATAATTSFLRPLVSFTATFRCTQLSPRQRFFATRATTSSLSDPNPNWSNRPPKETILLDGCDFEHWLVVMEKPDESLTRDEIIDSYIKTLAQVVGR